MMQKLNRSTGWILIVLFAATFAGCKVSDRSVIDQAADTHKALTPAIIEDAQLTAYLQSIGDRVIDAAKQEDADKVGPKTHFVKGQDNAWMFSNQMKFHLVNSKTLNAFTTGGEHMYIYNQLFQTCKTEDELAAVMSHEYAHVYSRHVAQGQQHQMETLAAGALLGAGAGYAVGGKDNGLQYAEAGAGAGAAGGQFVNMGFTRKDEAQADQYGFIFYTHAGWDPNHFGDFFQAMIDLGYDKTPGYMSDHPTLASRVVAAKKEASQLPANASQWRKPPIADDSHFKQLQQRAADLAKKLPDDSTLQSSQKLLQALPRSCVAPVDPQDAMQARQDLAQQVQQSQNGSTSKKKKKAQNNTATQ